MTDKPKYVVVESSSISGLEANVDTLLNAGYIISGGVSAVGGVDWVTLYQAMVLEEITFEFG